MIEGRATGSEREGGRMKNKRGQKMRGVKAGERIEKVSWEEINRRGKWMTMQKRDEVWGEGGDKRHDEQKIRNRGRALRAGDEETESKLHLWVSLLIRYLEEVDGVSQGGFLQRQGEDQGELLG